MMRIATKLTVIASVMAATAIATAQTLPAHQQAAQEQYTADISDINGVPAGHVNPQLFEYDFERPRATQHMIGQALVWTPDEVGGLAALLRGSDFWLCPRPVYLISGGFERMDGGEYGSVVTGEVSEGVWANRSGQSQYVFFDPNEEPVAVPPGSVIAVGRSVPFDRMPAGAANDQGSACSVSCGNSTYACCSSNGCHCRPSGQNDSDCVGGGRNATACSYGGGGGDDGEIERFDTSKIAVDNRPHPD